MLLRYRDKEKYHITVYFTKSNTDEDAARLQQYVDDWVNVFGMKAGQAADRIHGDQIDILVDLTGHTANNRLDIMACRPAPIQVTWIGYPNTTGLDYIHYRVTDYVTDPVDTTQPFSEKLIRLPDNFLCFSPHPKTPDVNACPFDTNGWVTFGSFNSLGKVQDKCFQLWASVLQNIPESRICLKSNVAFSSPYISEIWYKKFEAKGIARERVLLIGYISGQDGHLSAYHHVDIALDAHPYGGTTTISEAMVMGAPVITLRAPRDKPLHAWNVGLGMNTTFDQVKDLIAETEEEFVEIAKRLAADKDRLRGFRANLRQDFLKSPLGDAPRYQRNAEEMYQTMWAQYCSGDWPPNDQYVIAQTKKEVNASAWLHYRLIPVKLRESSAKGVQISEFRFFDEEGTQISPATVENPGGNIEESLKRGETADKLIDGMASTKWLGYNHKPVIFAFCSPVVAVSYEWVTCGDAPERDMISWIIEGRKAETDPWTILHVVSNHATTTDRGTLVARFPLETETTERGRLSESLWKEHVLGGGGGLSFDTSLLADFFQSR